MQVENRYLILHRLVNDISIYSFIWYNERKIEGVVHAYIYLCEILKPLVKILLKIMKNQLLNKFLCNNCTLYESTNSGFVKRKMNWEIALMVNFPSYISQWHANVLCISYIAQESQYLVDTNNEQVFTLLARPSTIFPLLHRSCDVGDRCAKGGEG